MKWGVLAVVVVVVMVGLLLMLWLRGRRLGMGGPGAVMGRIDLRRGFPRTRRKGYAADDVDELMDRTYSLATTQEGRAEALALLHEGQFGLARRGGYDPEVVDLHVDAMIVALQTGRGFPRRPGTA